MNSFQQIKRSLHSDSGSKPAAVIAVATVLLGMWTAWAFCARVTRYEVSDSARLEIDAAAYPVQVVASGRLRAVHLNLGQLVEAGDVLLEFDDQNERLALAEARTRLATLNPQIAALHAELEAENAAATDEGKVLRVSETGAESQLAQADAEAALAQEEWSRAKRLHDEKLISDAEAARARTAAESKHAAVENLRAAMARLRPELAVRQRDREIKSRQTALDLAKLQAEIANAEANTRTLEVQIDRKQVRAPIAGRLAECAALRPGSHVAEGERVGMILPAGKLQVIAQFQPSAALGKVRAGQHAVLRLQGFPWAQYGTVATQVFRVADEIRDGKVRVELAVSQAIPSRIPAQHGLPGSIEVEIERVSPATLILRTAGELVGAR